MENIKMANDILYIDDDRILVYGIQKLYENKIPIKFVYSAEEALDLLLRGEKFKVILSDYIMPGINGVEFLKEANKFNPEAIKVLITGNAEFKMAIEAVNSGHIFRLISKPFDFNIIGEVIEDCLTQYRLVNIEKLDKLKSDIITVFSHEVRTPLTVINNDLYLIKNELNGNGNEKINAYIQRVDETTRRLVKNLNKIESLSLLLNGSLEIKRENIDLFQDLLKPILSEFTSIFKRRFKINYSPDENYSINCDIVSLEHIIYELIDNAVKFSSEEEIEIVLNKNKDKLQISINDYGIGFSSDFEDLAEPFFQEDNGNTRKFNGNGLGLTLVNKLCQLNEISIDFEKNEPKGTRVKLQI